MKKPVTKKSASKTSPVKKPATAAKRKRGSATTSRAKARKPPVAKQPPVKQQAAVAHAMFLHGDDAWSLQYFDPNDLHFKEREVFG